MEDEMACPCGSENPFEACCGPFLTGEALPDTAEKLMRSRYTAYTRADVTYLERTLAPEEKEGFDPSSAKEWAQSSKWLGLKILSTKKGGPSDITGEVEFIATYQQDGKKINHHESSLFRKTKEGQWLFVEGDARAAEDPEASKDTPKPVPSVRDKPKTGRNDPCPCGSGRKYKKCCEGT